MEICTCDELNKIEAAEELVLASLQSDRARRNPVTIRVIRIGDALCVRPYKDGRHPDLPARQATTRLEPR